uniref:Uncharacterized protein n=1 Tax=Anguilla anguilla TaxID=7936 RepID=A0A0E9VT87_ANGAN
MMHETHGSREEGGPWRVLMYRAQNFVLHSCSENIKEGKEGINT